MYEGRAAREGRERRAGLGAGRRRARDAAFSILSVRFARNSVVGPKAMARAGDRQEGLVLKRARTCRRRCRPRLPPQGADFRSKKRKMAVRIALVGPLAAGKTVMKRQFVHGAEAFAPWHEGEPASDFSSAPSLTAGWFSGSRAVAMGDRRVVLEVWDSPAGLGRFRPSTMAVIATGTLRLGAVVLLFDVTKRAHFEEIRTWLRELEAIGCQGAAVYLVGNKVDLAASRAVLLREMQMLASHPLLSADRVFETSARTGEGVEALFGNLAFPAALAGTWRSAEHPRGPLTWAPDPVAELRDLSTPDGPSARVDLPRLAAAIATAREAGAPAADIARAEAVVEAAARFSGARREAKAQVALGHDGFSLSPVLSGPDGATWTRLSQLLDTDPDHLGTGKDVQKAFGPYDRRATRCASSGHHLPTHPTPVCPPTPHPPHTHAHPTLRLRLASAWRIAHPRCRAQYAAGRDRVRDDLDLIRKRGRLPTGTLPGLPTRTSEAAAGFGMDDGANEALLLHGTSPAYLLDVLSNGLNERFSGTSAGAAFGEGPSRMTPAMGLSGPFWAGRVGAPPLGARPHRACAASRLRPVRPVLLSSVLLGQPHAHSP